MTHFDLAIIGTGSGNSVVNEEFSHLRIAILEEGTFGGTCLNVGCIPTKMFVYPADLAYTALHAQPLGVDTTLDKVHWPEIRDRIFARIDPISEAGRRWRTEGNDNVTVYGGHARFTAPLELDTGTGETITADQIVLAAGSRAVVPPIEGIDQVEHHTSDTIMRIDDLPRRLAIIGGGFVAAEFAHVFGSFGTHVTIINRSGALLREEDHDISERFTEIAQQRWDVRLDSVVSKVEEYDGGIRVHLSRTTDLSGRTAARASLHPDKSVLDVDMLLIATGRRSNSDGLDLENAGVEVDAQGLVKVDGHQRTSAPGVWALGDISNRYQLKHVSNHEARVVQHNLLHPDDLVTANHDNVPSAVFTYPQIASVGLTEKEAEEQGIRYVIARQAFGDTAYGWAMEDNTSFAKVLADPATGLLLGAHLIGPQSSNLIQPLIHAMSFGQTAHDVARGQYWIHPALSEVVENVLLALETDPASTATPG